NAQLMFNGGYFYSATSSVDGSPFTPGTNVILQVSTTSPLTNGQTYWMRVRAREFSSTAYSLWSVPRSFTVDTNVGRSAWFQTTTAQVNNDSLVRTVGSNDPLAVWQDTGKNAIYYEAGGGEGLTTTAVTLGHDTTVTQANLFSMANGSSSITLNTGYYAVMYG